MLSYIGGVYSVLGAQEKARAYYDQVMQLYQALGKNREASTLNSLGDLNHQTLLFRLPQEWFNAGAYLRPSISEACDTNRARAPA
jgi:hypothetical protein